MSNARPRKDDSPAEEATTATSSQQDAPHQDSSAGNASKRRAFAGNRAVVNLTPEQLTKKRANDREAQRVIRERTKGHIEGLERRIRELEGEEPYKAMQKLAEERDRAVEECNMLRNKLVLIQNLATGVHLCHSLNRIFKVCVLHLSNRSNLPSVLTKQLAENPQGPLNKQQPDDHSMAIQPYEATHPHQMLRSPFSETQPSSAGLTATSTPTYQASARTYHKWSSSLERVMHSQDAPTTETPYEQSSPSLARSEPSDRMWERLDLNYVLEPKQGSELTPQSLQEPSPYQSASPLEPIYSRLPNNAPPSSPLDSMLVDFVTNCRKQVASGKPVQDVRGPEYPAFAALKTKLSKESSTISSNNVHPLSGLMILIISTFPGFNDLPERVASFYSSFLLLRWEICPCRPCYERMPEWLRPAQDQFDMPHQSWIDHVPWRHIRLRLITTRPVEIRDIFIAYQKKLSLNWPYADELVFFSTTDGRGDEIVQINPVFDSHWRDLNNWSLGTEFKDKFSELVDESVRIKD